MLIAKNFFYLILLHLGNSFPQINFHLTDWISNNKNDVVIQYDCLYVTATIKNETDPHQIISYCLTEWSSKWNISQNNSHQKLTFDELYKKNITSQQLYLWSAPIDTIERYQFYLNQFSTSNESSLMGTLLFYNCTSPRFGSQCQYSFDNYRSYHTSINEIIYDFYQDEYNPTDLTCYNHLVCNRGSTSICLDWTEICDGTRDCRDGIDEESCWQLKFNGCEENEYQCLNGQCISKIFFLDGGNTFECIDRSDEFAVGKISRGITSGVHYGEPAIVNEDIACPVRFKDLDLQLTSSCLFKRNKILGELLFDDKLNGTSDDCRLAVKCQFNMEDDMSRKCVTLCSNQLCKAIINQTCPDMFIAPASIIAFGHMFFIYNKDAILSEVGLPPPNYICYDDQLCDGLYLKKSLISFNNATCHRPEDFPITFNSIHWGRSDWYGAFVLPLYQHLSQCNKIVSNDSASCNELTMYKCLNSLKCILKGQVCDQIRDCDYGDDEVCPLINGSCSSYGIENLFACMTNKRCITQSLVNDGFCHCGRDKLGVCDDEDLDIYYSKTQISFPTICDGFIELSPIIIDGENVTDETECEYWECNNTYTRCDGFWNCLNGADEVNCNSISSLLNCSNHDHVCVSPRTNQFMCLPIEKANDGNIDCLGGTDEPKLCRSNTNQHNSNNFYCNTYQKESCISSIYLCFSSNCKDGSDIKFCDKNRNIEIIWGICSESYKIYRSDIENFFCTRKMDKDKSKIKNFALEKLTKLTTNSIQERIHTISSHRSIRQTFVQNLQNLCHRGLPLRIWLDDNKNLSTIACLCPPSSYGDRCQYQNQRVSLTVQFQTFADSRRMIFVIIILLIDDSNEQNIHSYEQITYVYIKNCRTKFNIYLLYSTRPKHSEKNYSLHIDIYEKISLTYRSSMIIPIKYSFLSVHRIAVHLTIPGIENIMEICSDSKCINGQCMRYSNKPNDYTFCQCYKGWFGKYCDIQLKCTCSSDSLCLGILANNRSICVCPLYKWGSQCILNNTICDSNGNKTCHNNGQCIPIDENSASLKQFLCLCPKGFSGERCEIPDNKIILSFDKNIILPEVLLIHFIRIIDNGPPENGSTFKMILTNRTFVTIEWSDPFHIAFLEMYHNFYLITIQKIYNRSTSIIRKISSSDHCKHIREVFNETISNLHLLRRIKYYHLACQNDSVELPCFYDDNYFCLCYNYGKKRLANCFEFNSSIEHNCFGLTNCKNGAECLQDRPFCPQKSICVCPKCFYGEQCQFSSNLFDLSLDGLLGYFIQPNVKIKYQPSIVKFTIGLTTLMILVGFINSILLIITFKNKEPRKIGCGIYLLTSSIINLINIIIFTLKFWILIIAQISYITNRSFLYFQCMSIDYILRINLSMDQWMSASISMERALTIIKGINFNKNKSKKMAKYIICLLLVFIIITTIQDPISRRLFDEYDDEFDRNRIWCIVNYSSNLRIFNSITVMFHFFAPFIINIFSAITIIVKGAQQRQTVRTQQTYQKLLYEEFRQHFNLLISPICFIILAIPRIIISFVSGCMKSISGSWLYLIAYLISFIPSLVTFLVFVIPSKTYKEVFYNALKQYRNKLQMQFRSVL